MTKSRKKSVTRGWRKLNPSHKQRTIMLSKCGRKCFLGPHKSYPICSKNTCKINPKGIYSAFIRARQYKNKNVSQKAHKMLVTNK